MRRYLLIMAPLLGIVSGGFVWLMSYCFGLRMATVGACMLAWGYGLVLVEIALEVAKWKAR